MTNKEKLINWAREKFENDKRCKIVLLLDYIMNIEPECKSAPYICSSYLKFVSFKIFESFVNNNYDNNLNEDILNVRLFGNVEEYNKVRERLEEYNITMIEACIKDFYWKSSEDRKLFNNK